MQVCLLADCGYPLGHAGIVAVANFVLLAIHPNAKPITMKSKWAFRWAKRHKDIIAHRLVEARSTLRILSANPSNVADFFTIIGSLYKRFGRTTRDNEFDQNAFLTTVNVDECGTDTHGRCFSKRCFVGRGADTAFVPVEGERGKHISIVASVCSDGSAVPPVVILPGATQKFTQQQLQAYDPKTTVTYTKSGWSNKEVFLWVLKSIVAHLKRRYPSWAERPPHRRKPVLILVDGHSSHESVDILQYALDNNIWMVRSPPHCTHVVQVLDSHQLFGAFQPLLSHYIQDLCTSGDVVNVRNFGVAFTQAWNKIFGDADRIRHVFEEYGQCPFNPSRLDISKLQQQVVLRSVTQFQELTAAGMHADKAEAIAKLRATTPLFSYTEEWKQRILEEFCERVDDTGVTPEATRRQNLVSHAVVTVLGKRGRTVATGPRKRVRAQRVLCSGAALMNTEARIAELRQKEEDERSNKAEAAKRAKYIAERNVKVAEIDRQNAERAQRKAGANEELKVAKEGLEDAKSQLKIAQRASKEQVRRLCPHLFDTNTIVCLRVGVDAGHPTWMLLLVQWKWQRKRLNVSRTSLRTIPSWISHQVTPNGRKCRRTVPNRKMPRWTTVTATRMMSVLREVTQHKARAQ